MAKRENGAQFPETSDIENLKNSLSDLNENSLSKRERKVLGSIVNKPGLSDFERYLGNLDMIVPMGFWMVHNDLEKLQEIVEKSSGSESKGGSGVASAITAVATTVSAATDLIEVIKSPAGLGDILNNEEINELLATDPTVYDIRLAGTQAYLKAYYSNLINNIGYSLDWTTNAVTPNEGFDFGNFVNDIAQGFGAVIGSAITSAADGLNNVKAQEKLESDDVISATRLTGFRGYLKAYYSNLINNLGYALDWESGTIVPDTSFGSIMNDIGSAIGNILGSAVQSVGNAVADISANVALNKEEDVLATRKEGYKAYLKAYYANMIEPMGYVVTADSLNSNSYYLERKATVASVIDDITSGITGILGNFIESVGNSVTDVAANALLNFNDDIKATRVKGYSAYLKAYYANMIEPLGYAIPISSLNGTGDTYTLTKSETASSILDKITSGITDIAGNLVNSVGNALVDTTANAFLNTDEEIKSIRLNGYKSYVKAYYANMLSAFGYEFSIEDINKGDFTLKEKDTSWWGKFKEGFGEFTSAIGQGIGNILSGAGTGASMGLIPQSVRTDPEVLAVSKEGYKKILSAYYDAFDTEKVKFNDGTIDNDYREIKNSFISSLKDGFKSYANGSIDFNENNIIEIDNDEMLGKMDDLVDAIKDNNVDGKLTYIQGYTGNIKDSLSMLNTSIEKLISIMESKDYGTTTVVNGVGGSLPRLVSPQLSSNGSMF